MIQPIELQLAHFTVERTAQITKDAIAAAQQTGQGKEIVEENLRRAQTVQAGVAAAESGKVKRREDEEGRERRRERQDQGKSFSAHSGSSLESSDAIAELSEAETGEIKVKKAPKHFELYA